jgi:hypothetical protein
MDKKRPDSIELPLHPQHGTQPAVDPSGARSTGASGTADRPLRAAQDLLRRGREAAAAGDHETAVRLFREGHAVLGAKLPSLATRT